MPRRTLRTIITTATAGKCSRSAFPPNTGVADRQFVWGLRYIDDCVLRDRTTTGTLNERLYAMQDANWNVVAICNTSASVLERYAYTAYGVVQFLNGSFTPLSGNASAYEWETLYCSYRYEAATGLSRAIPLAYSAARLLATSRDPGCTARRSSGVQLRS